MLFKNLLMEMEEENEEKVAKRRSGKKQSDEDPNLLRSRSGSRKEAMNLRSVLVTINLVI